MSTARAQLEVRRPGGDLPPIVMVGWPDMENALLAQLPRTVPIWWLKLDGFFAPPFEIRPLAAIAAAYAEEISNRRPRGPIHLVGFSVGALIAAELSERLHCAGRKAQVLLLEPPLPGGLPARAKLRRRARALHKTEHEQHRAAQANAAESLRERFCRHLGALCRRGPLAGTNTSSLG
jgi:thioesterase domain-containing protein